jgi:23S rRNA-/tRNA-specific pseudouridylate synthase
MTGEAQFISFPEGRLTEASIRLDLIADHEGWFALSKPPGLVLLADPWQAGTVDLVSALRTEVSAGKHQLATLGIVAPSAINGIDVDESGVAILAKNDDAAAALRNLHGSAGLKMTYEFLAEGSAVEPVFECSLPLSRHREQQRVMVSHTTGKKASTVFRRVESFGLISQWEAETSYSRIHQIRIHAAESGLGILGERLYKSVPFVCLSDLKRKFRRRGKPERPIYGHIALHLKWVEIAFPDQAPIRIEAPPPKGYSVLIKRLRQYSV